MPIDRTQINRWILPRPINEDDISNSTFNYILQKVLCRRGIKLEEELENYITPSNLPNPNDHFNDLSKATQRIITACDNNESIAICGDYDADGITSTVLLMELFNILGANAISYIPSRQEDGYGLNVKMINDINAKEIKLIITVDNGISSFDAIQKSKQFGIDLIITDHHKIPSNNQEIFSLIHPELAPLNSPYKCLAGVGIAYLLAKNICNQINFDLDKTSANVLFSIGTVADMAPLIGANRKWLKECLPKIHNTENIGLIEIFKRLEIDTIDISTNDIGFKIAPLINSVGRISDPKKIIDLLTSSSTNYINELINECFSINNERKRMTTIVERDAMEIATNDFKNNKKFLVLYSNEWHPGIIGIVAARLVEKFNLPTALISRSSDGIFRGSIRSNNILHVNLALDECKDILLAYGGHPAAAGFSIREENIYELKKRLNNIATREMKSSNLDKSINPDAYIAFKDINSYFYRQLLLLGPFGVMNKEPIFWTRKCKIKEIYILKGKHAKMILDDGTSIIEAIKWNISKNLYKNDLIDIAFQIQINKWKRSNKLQLNIIDIKCYKKIIHLQIHNNTYKCQEIEDKKIVITNSIGNTISSNLSKNSFNKENKKEIFAKKILSFAEIALGKAA